MNVTQINALTEDAIYQLPKYWLIGILKLRTVSDEIKCLCKQAMKANFGVTVK